MQKTLFCCFRFLSVKRRFMLELNNLRKEPASPSVNANIISLNTGMRFFRVKVKYFEIII